MKNSYLITDINRIEFKEQGYTIIDNFLAQELHDELLNEFDEANYEINYQLRHGYYQEKLKSNNINHPNENEFYIAKFKKLKSLKKMQSLQKFFEENIISIVKEISKTFRIPYFFCSSESNLKKIVKKIFKSKGPALIDCCTLNDHEIIPSIKSKLINERLVAQPLNNMYPYLK